MADRRWDSALLPLTAPEVAFLAGDETLQIVPNFTLPSLEFIGVSGPHARHRTRLTHNTQAHTARSRCGQGPTEELRPGIPAEVPLWLAVYLRKRDKCQIVVPEWLEPERLAATLEAEQREQDKFAELPFNYLVVAKELLTIANEEVRELEGRGARRRRRRPRGPPWHRTTPVPRRR